MMMKERKVTGKDRIYRTVYNIKGTYPQHFTVYKRSTTNSYKMYGGTRVEEDLADLRTSRYLYFIAAAAENQTCTSKVGRGAPPPLPPALSAPSPPPPPPPGALHGALHSALGGGRAYGSGGGGRIDTAVMVARGLAAVQPKAGQEESGETERGAEAEAWSVHMER